MPLQVSIPVTPVYTFLSCLYSFCAIMTERRWFLILFVCVQMVSCRLGPSSKDSWILDDLITTPQWCLYLTVSLLIAWGFDSFRRRFPFGFQVHISYLQGTKDQAASAAPAHCPTVPVAGPFSPCSGLWQCPQLTEKFIWNGTRWENLRRGAWETDEKQTYKNTSVKLENNQFRLTFKTSSPDSGKEEMSFAVHHLSSLGRKISMQNCVKSGPRGMSSISPSEIDLCKKKKKKPKKHHWSLHADSLRSCFKGEVFVET